MYFGVDRWLSAIPSLLAFSFAPSYKEPSISHEEHTSSADPHKRWMTLIFSDKRKNTPTVWPRSSPKNYHYIRYCFATSPMRDDAKCLVDNAISLWAEALGGHASARTDHSLIIKEVRDDRMQPIFCYKPGTIHEPESVNAKSHRGEWTEDLDPAVLAIWIVEQSEIDQATIGYVPEAEDDTPGRHYLQISRDTVSEQGTSRVAHEIGHVLGMGHEQQREDRDSYVRYDCTLVRGYASALKRFRVDNPSMSENEASSSLCNSLSSAKKYNELLSSFVKHESAQASQVFDLESIMLYNSLYGAEDACENNMEKCPLLKIVKNEKGEAVGYAKIEENLTPSKGDVAYVLRWYGYMDPEPGTKPDVPPKPSSLRAKPSPPPLPPRPGSTLSGQIKRV